ncbi:hypothetical protein EV426DRAFT_209700 [Tirmania nivea]|nr:hypothetical protein EV426DRAFT_209700 [Tirmania nivea]
MAKRLQREFDQEDRDPPPRSGTTTQPLVTWPTVQRPPHVTTSSQASSSSTSSNSEPTLRDLYRAGLTQLRILDLQESCGPWCYGECDNFYSHLYGSDITNDDIWNLWDLGVGNFLHQTEQTQEPRHADAGSSSRSTTVDSPRGSKSCENEGCGNDSSKEMQEISDLEMAKRLQKKFDEEAGNAACDISTETSNAYGDVKTGLEDSSLSGDYQSSGIQQHEANNSEPPRLRHVPAYSSPLRLGYYGAGEGTYISTTMSERGPNCLKRNTKRHGWNLKKLVPPLWRQLLIGLGFVANHLCKRSINGCKCEYERDELLGEPEIFSTIPRVTLKGLPNVKEKCDFCIDKDFEIGRQHLRQLGYRDDPDIPDDDTVIGGGDDESDDEVVEDGDEGKGAPLKRFSLKPRTGGFVDSEDKDDDGAVSGGEEEEYGYPLQKYRSVVRQGSNHTAVEGNINSSSPSNMSRAGAAISPEECGSPSDEEVRVHGLFSDLPNEYRIGIRSYLWGTLCSILADLLKHSPDHTTEPQEYLLLLKQAVTPAYHQLLRYLSTMRLFATRYAQEKRGMELSIFAMQLALELYWNIRRHVERGGDGGGEQQILEIVDISKVPVAQAAHRPPGPPRLSPIQPWKTPNLHKERLIAYARGVSAGRGELRTKTGLPQFSGDPLAFRYSRKYGNYPPGFGGLPYGHLGPEAEGTLRGNNRTETEDKRRGIARLKGRKVKVRAQAHRRRVRTRERATIAQHRKIFRKILYLEGPRENDALQFLRSPDLILLRKQRRLSKTYVRKIIRSVDEKRLEVEDQDQLNKRGKREGQGQDIKEDGEGRILCDDGDTDSDDSDEDDEYFEDVEDGRVGDNEGSRKDMEHSNAHGDEYDDAGGDDWDDGDYDAPSAFHVEDSKLDKSVKSGETSQTEDNDDQAEDGEDSYDDADDGPVAGEWVANMAELIQIQIQKEMRKRKKAMERLSAARERLKRDPKFRLLPSARRRWVTVEPSSAGRPFTTSTDMPITIRGGFDGFSNNAKDENHAVLKMGKSRVPGPSKACPGLVPGTSILTVMFQSHQAGEGSDPPPAPRPQHAVPLPTSVPSPAAFTQPSFRSPYVPQSPPPPPYRPLPQTTQSVSLAPSLSATPNSPVSTSALLQSSFTSPYAQPFSPPSQPNPWSTPSASRTSVLPSTQYPATASTPSDTAFSQSSFSYPYVLPSTHPQSSTSSSYPSTHNHPLPASVPSTTFSQPFFTSPYAQSSSPQPQSIPWSNQFASPTSIPSSTQSYPNLSVSSSSSQLQPLT